MTRKDRRGFREIFRALDQLGPMIWHDHANGRARCPACQVSHPLAPHFGTCGCGHCPDPDTARAAVTAGLLRKDQDQETRS